MVYVAKEKNLQHDLFCKNNLQHDLCWRCFCNIILVARKIYNTTFVTNIFCNITVVAKIVLQHYVCCRNEERLRHSVLDLCQI